jgi:hypothetical protein
VGEAVTYFAVALQGKPAGVARRRLLTDGGIEDEMLRQDLTWQPDSLIVEWKRGDASEELAEISEEDAAALIERFREKWCRLTWGLERLPAISIAVHLISGTGVRPRRHGHPAPRMRSLFTRTRQ